VDGGVQGVENRAALGDDSDGKAEDINRHRQTGADERCLSCRKIAPKTRILLPGVDALDQHAFAGELDAVRTAKP
jgi:hypothetical protein